MAFGDRAFADVLARAGAQRGGGGDRRGGAGCLLLRSLLGHGGLLGSGKLAEHVLGRGHAELAGRLDGDDAGDARSEEHTAEIPFIMSISYSVFCLKKKKYANDRETNNE